MTTTTVDPSKFTASETRPIMDLRDVRLNLRSAAGEVNILRGISLEINAGDMVSVVGPSGAGKSTLMMLIGGLETATSGQVNVAGHDLSTMREDALAEFRRDHVGIVFQAFRLIPTMSAMENVAIPLELAGEDNAFEKARESLGRVGLAERVHHYPDQLSGGEQQRVAIARAFVGKPKILLADEPTGNLDRATGDDIVNLLFDLRETHGTTLVLITHDESLARRCDRMIRMADGRIVESPAAADADRKSA
jgi:putative ABC transport system ATP-binding protein